MASWSVKRRWAYFMSILGFFAVIAAGLYINYRHRPTCFDNIKNSDELGVDCGGSCTLACSVQLAALKSLWARPFYVRQGVYDFAALVENVNQNFGVKQLSYTIRIFDNQNILIRERRGKTYVNSGESFILFEPGIETGERVVARAFIEFDEKSAAWEKITVEKPKLSITHQPFDNGPHPRLVANISNPSTIDLENVSLVAILSGRNQNAFAVSSTLVESLPSGASRGVVFTWPEPFPEAPDFIDLYPSFNVFKLK